MSKRFGAIATLIAVGAAAEVGSATAIASHSTAPPAVRQAFAAHRFVSGPPREVGRVHGPGGFFVLWASPASGGGWCEGLQRLHVRFTRMSVSCVWPKSWMRRRIDLTYSYPPFTYWGRVPRQSAQTLRLALSDGRSLSVPMRNRFFLFLIPDHVLAHTAPTALVAADSQGRVVAREAIPSFVPLNGGGITHPPGGAVLRQKREIVARPTVVGQASVWSAPDRVSAGHCSWLQIGLAVYGGSCRRDQPPRRGLSEVVPLVLQIKGQTLPLLWGQVGANVARLGIVFQDGRRLTLSHRDGVFLYPVPQSRWSKGHRPAFLVGRDKRGRVVGKRLLYEFTLAQ